MTVLSEIGGWITANEALLSGLAAMIVLAGVLFSPVGAGLRRLGRSGAGPPGAASRAQLSFQDLTKPGPAPVRFADSDGVRIAYNEQGRGPITIILAPGIFSHLHIMANMPSSKDSIAALTRFARVICFDKRGQGLSDPTMQAPDLDERTRDIEAVMDAAGVERAVLLGFSEGGPMCLKFAWANPDRVQGLVLVGTTAKWVQTDDFPIGLPLRVLERLPEAWGTARLRGTFYPSISRDQIDDDTYRSFEQLIGSRAAVRQLAQMMIGTDMRGLLPEIHVPTLVVHFTGDLAVPIRMGRAVAEGLPNAEFLEVNGVDHADLSQSREALEKIRAFCERVSPAAA
ncbi:MAG: alpha/beta hydrolase [Deltaproteobacteria bacterium]|jgi:pimeloyl-ACP methyl ester carboxylesterase|nr:alpha/beta hydrolase [Deltaproteobacteria bacterium]